MKRTLFVYAALAVLSARAPAQTPSSSVTADAVVVNDISRADIGFDAPDNEVILITADGEERVAKAAKDRIAAAIVDRAEELLRERAP